MSNRFIGIQLGPASVYDEGADHCLDLIQEHGGVNAVIVATHSYYGAHGRSAKALAPDHGVPVRDERERNVTKVWINHHERYFGGTYLRHRRDPQTEEYADRDVLADLLEPTRRRGMKLLARILEPHQRRSVDFIDNWPKVMAIDVYGRIYPNTCFNHPQYVNFWLSTVEDMFKSYPIDGLQYGSERSGPLSRVLLHGEVPSCFCEHCCARARAKGIDPERAREGYLQLYEYVTGLKSNTVNPVDGAFVTLVRILLKYPEVLAWEYDAYTSREELTQKLYGLVKAIRPDAQFGVHIDHQQSTYDLFQLAELEYAELARYCDFIKPIAYHDIAAPRVRRWLLDSVHGSFLRELPLEHLLSGFYDIMGLDKNKEPKLDEMDTNGFTEDYVYRLTKRIVTDVGGKVPVYPGIGFDVLWNADHFPANPDTIYKAVHRAFEAGAGGIVLSREYAEMRLPNLKAAGRAVRDLGL
ncbi:hypothetical protein [Paenibacillus humicola]|uniref:hypothetical protein n=1 Tax=Paenibacillus humicola TaxID=3110540 RepID=UPI00237C371A|nr:hypothetical protein [Paenibacillus humicola]